MDEQMKLQRAREIFSSFCHVLDVNDWHYNKNAEELTIGCGVQGDDLPIEIAVQVDVDRQVVLLLSEICVIEEDKRVDAAVAVSAINNLLVNGSFDYDIGSGKIWFRMTNSFMESVLGYGVFEYMLYCSCQTIDEYNDRLLMLSKGLLSFEQFFSASEE